MSRVPWLHSGAPTAPVDLLSVPMHASLHALLSGGRPARFYADAACTAEPSLVLNYDGHVLWLTHEDVRYAMWIQVSRSTTQELVFCARYASDKAYPLRLTLLATPGLTRSAQQAGLAHAAWLSFGRFRNHDSWSHCAGEKFGNLAG